MAHAEGSLSQWLEDNESDEYSVVLWTSGGVFRGFLAKGSVGTDYLTLKLADSKTSIVRIRLDQISAATRMWDLENKFQAFVNASRW